MLKKIITATAIIVCSLTTHAAEVKSWNFQWAGTFDYAYGTSIPHYRLIEGSFSAIDADNNNNITANELTSLTLEGYSLLPCAGGEGCNISTFNYNGGNDLTIAAGYEYISGSGRTFRNWNNIYGGELQINWGDYCMSCDTFTLVAKDDVVFTVTPVAEVPEPKTYLMLLAGLLGLGFAGRNKKAVFKKN